jgi:hypothetical protein
MTSRNPPTFYLALICQSITEIWYLCTKAKDTFAPLLLVLKTQRYAQPTAHRLCRPTTFIAVINALLQQQTIQHLLRIAEILDSVHCLISQIAHISETGPVPILR